MTRNLQRKRHKEMNMCTYVLQLSLNLISPDAGHHKLPQLAVWQECDLNDQA